MFDLPSTAGEEREVALHAACSHAALHACRGGISLRGLLRGLPSRATRPAHGLSWSSRPSACLSLSWPRSCRIYLPSVRLDLSEPLLPLSLLSLVLCALCLSTLSRPRATLVRLRLGR